jgi:hypothetical protein
MEVDRRIAVDERGIRHDALLYSECIVLGFGCHVALGVKAGVSIGMTIRRKGLRKKKSNFKPHELVSSLSLHSLFFV